MKAKDVKKRNHMLRIVAVVLLVAGALMPIGGISASIGFPLIAIGISLIVIVQRDEQRRRDD
jgi:membrane-bound ClpP family serine protease